MKKFILVLILIFTQGFLMGAEISTINGVTPLIVESDRKLPIVSMRIVFLSSGAINDRKSPGLAALSAGLLNEGTKKLGAVKFARQLEEKAIIFSADTSRETLYIDLSALSEHFDEGLNLLIELLKDPNLAAAPLNKVKTNAIGDLMQKENDFDYIAGVGLQALLFENTAIENPQLGTIESVQKITLKDVKGFLSESLVKERAVLLFGGDINLEEAGKKGGKVLSALKSGRKSYLPSISARKNSAEKLVKRDTKQAYIYFGSPFNMKAGDEESYKANVASFILGGGGFGSRIMEEVRVKRGLAYSAYGHIILSMTGGSFKGHLQTKEETLDEAKSVIKQVMKEFVEKGVREDELSAAKKFLLGSEPLRNETMSQRLSRAFSDYYCGKPQGWSAEQLKKIESLNLNELNEFIFRQKELADLSFFVVKNK